MHVVWHDPEEADCQVHDWASVPNMFSGGQSLTDSAPKESLLNPRAIGFGRGDPFYVPVYWVPEE